jgi:hypothetical protein
MASLVGNDEEKTRLALIEEVSRLVDEMSRPLPWRSKIPWKTAAGGWNESRRKEWLRYFEDLRARLAAGESAFEWDASHLTRAMDHDGIESGRWLAAAEEIQARLRILEQSGGDGARKVSDS